MGALSTFLLSFGSFLIVMAIRFFMIKNSLDAGKPTKSRKKTLIKECKYFSFGGLVLFALGTACSFIPVYVNVAHAVENMGSIIFGLGVPQYIQYYYGKNDDNYCKYEKHLNKLKWGSFIIGAISIIVSPISSWAWGW
jgi:O-antigen/teichoic acid export membrane protein